MIKGIEDLSSKLQKAVLGYITSMCDVSEDIEVEYCGDNIIKINDCKLYVITDQDIQEKLASYNADIFDEFFLNLSTEQKNYIDEDKWSEERDLTNFNEYLEEIEDYEVIDSYYYGSYNFYEIC